MCRLLQLHGCFVCWINKLWEGNGSRGGSTLSEGADVGNILYRVKSNWKRYPWNIESLQFSLIYTDDQIKAWFSGFGNFFGWFKCENPVIWFPKSTPILPKDAECPDTAGAVWWVLRERKADCKGDTNPLHSFYCCLKQWAVPSWHTVKQGLWQEFQFCAWIGKATLHSPMALDWVGWSCKEIPVFQIFLKKEDF